MSILFTRGTIALGAALLAFGLAACAGNTTPSTSGFSGETKQAAQAIVNLQSDLSNSNQKKVCTNDLSAAVVERLRASSGVDSTGTAGCEAAIKRQLEEVDNLELAINSIKVLSATTAEAVTRSIYEGKTRLSTVQLIKEAGKWKVSTVTLLPVKSKK